MTYLKINTLNDLGSSCTGSSGDTGRVLTLSNSFITVQSGFLVHVSGLALTLTSDYTVSHNDSGTEITFVNPVWDDMPIIVQFYTQLDGSAGDSGSSATNDFEAGPLNDFTVDVVRTPVTVTTNFHGDKTYSDGTDETIEAVFLNPNQSFNLGKAGLTEVFDAKIFVKEDQTLNKYDKITYDSRVYRVKTVNSRRFNGTVVYKMATLFYIEDE